MQRKHQTRSARRRSTVGADIREAVGWCLGFGVLFSVVVIGQTLIRGSDVALSVGLTLPVLIGLYLVGGLMAGVLIGLLKPYGHTRAGAVVVAMCAAFPFCLATALLIMEPGASLGFSIAFIVLCTVIVGGMGGLTISRVNRDLKRKYGI